MAGLCFCYLCPLPRPECCSGRRVHFCRRAHMRLPAGRSRTGPPFARPQQNPSLFPLRTAAGAAPPAAALVRGGEQPRKKVVMVPKPTPVSAKERERIIEALRAGESQTSVAKRFGRSSSTINRIAKEAGLEYSAPKNANEARWRFAK